MPDAWEGPCKVFVVGLAPELPFLRHRLTERREVEEAAREAAAAGEPKGKKIPSIWKNPEVGPKGPADF